MYLVLPLCLYVCVSVYHLLFVEEQETHNSQIIWKLSFYSIFFVMVIDHVWVVGCFDVRNIKESRNSWSRPVNFW